MEREREKERERERERELHPQEDNEEIFDPEISYLSAIGAIIFLVNYT